MSNNLVGNASKTVALPIYPDNNACNLRPELTLIFDRQILLPSTSAKYLAIILDELGLRRLMFVFSGRSVDGRLQRVMSSISPHTFSVCQPQSNQWP